ncbi:MAG: transposase [Candidatus Omnitrophica bacterium]|nr:transposase [Candidatus Omnitrophota bacterium]
MPRLARHPSPTGCYHVLARGHNRQPIFRDATDYQQYLALLTRFKTASTGQCYHFCLMPNHVHLVLATKTIDILTAWMRRVQQAYQFHWRRRYHLVGHLWQGRFKSLPIEHENYLLECARYIERNPVRAQLCARAEEHPWSSAAYYLTGQGMGQELLDRNPAYEGLGPTDQARRARYHEYLTATRPYEQLVDAQLQQLT